MKGSSLEIELSSVSRSVRSVVVSFCVAGGTVTGRLMNLMKEKAQQDESECRLQ